MKIQRLFLFLVIFLAPQAISASGLNKKPFIIPEVKEWEGDIGEFLIDEKTTIRINKNSTTELEMAKILANDLKKLIGLNLRIEEGKPIANSISFDIKRNKRLGEEGYQVKISDRVKIEAPYKIGLYWATRTLLQMAEQNKKISCGTIIDFPSYKVRGFMLDCARKFIPIEFLTAYVDIMAYYKMNTFQIHLNDNGFYRLHGKDWTNTYSAFRLECDTYPGLTAEDGHYTKKEFVALQKKAQSVFVNIIPELDIPAHSLAFSHYNEELGSKEYGMDHLDLFNPKTYSFLDGLFKEYLNEDNPVFIGDYVHIGTDEYSNKDKKVVEKFRYFTDYYIKLVESYGKKAMIWGALTHAEGETPVKVDDVTMLVWNNGYAAPEKMMELGYDIISIPDQYLYLVPNVGYYSNYLNVEKLYQSWTPSQVGKEKFEEDNKQILGGMFALWNDHVGNGISTKDIHHRVMPAMKALAVKMWAGDRTSIPFSEWEPKSEEIAEAPGVNLMGRVGNKESLVLNMATLHPQRKTNIREIGYDYTVNFDVLGKREDKGTVLFKSPNAQFYLADPIRGQLGFSRDGYLYQFNYTIKDNEKVNITIKGNSNETSLYINGKLRQRLGIQKQNEKGAFDEVFYYTQTLVFPLDETGIFKSRISNLKVYNYWVD